VLPDLGPALLLRLASLVLRWHDVRPPRCGWGRTDLSSTLALQLVHLFKVLAIRFAGYIKANCKGIEPLCKPSAFSKIRKLTADG
jgi:hypothetical protein